MRIILRYDSKSISDQDYESAIENVFSEPAVDEVYREELPFWKGDCLWGGISARAVRPARGFGCSVRAAAARKQRPQIATATIYALFGGTHSAGCGKIKKYVINPVDSRGGFYGKATFAGYAAFCA